MAQTNEPLLAHYPKSCLSAQGIKITDDIPCMQGKTVMSTYFSEIYLVLITTLGIIRYHNLLILIECHMPNRDTLVLWGIDVIS
jgi:hypothetical protein